ncbi:MAG: DUF3422 family protein [Alphaproteobacteria bacterium]|nr:DUF3422 family protein [Alphaproteobacteria bacterium]
MSIHKNPRLGPSKPERDERWETLCKVFAGHVNELRSAYAAGTPPKVNFIQPTSEVFEHPLRFTLERTAVVEITPQRHKPFRIRARLDVYTEICSITYIVDRIGAGATDIYPLMTGLLAPGDGSGAGPAQRVEAALDGLYNRLWSLNSPIDAAVTAQRWFEGESEQPGIPLTDFRGVVLPVCEAAATPRTARIARPALRPELRRFVDEHAELLRIATGRLDEAGQSPLSGEPVCCGMLGGAALYVAELGKRSPGVAIEPVRHMLLFGDCSASQVGRLVRRLHVLGEFRHAALLDYDNGEQNDLKRVSRELRELGRRVDEVFGLGPSARIGQLPDLLTRLNDLRANPNETGVLYRIEQSRYYAGEFKRTVPHLRSLRLENWQTYDDFVARYVYQLFARIDRVGTRYDALMRRLSLLTTFSLATEISDYQKNVAGVLKKLHRAAEALKNSAGSQVSVSEKQRSLLHEASFIAMAFLSYYVSSVLWHIFDVRLDDGIDRREAFHLASMAVTGLLSAYAVWLMVARLRNERHRAGAPADPADEKPPEP